MRKIEDLKTFITKTDMLLLLNENIKIYTLFENSTFDESYPNLNIPRRFVKNYVMPNRVTYKGVFVHNKDQKLKIRKDYKLQNVSENEDTESYIKDLTQNIDLIQKYFKYNYKNMKVLDQYALYFKENVAFNSNNVLIYAVDLDKDIPIEIFMRKIYPILIMIRYYSSKKPGFDIFPFKKILLNIYSSKTMMNQYIKIFDVDDQSHQYQRIVQILKEIQVEEKEKEEMKDEIQDNIQSYIKQNPSNFNITDDDYQKNEHVIKQKINSFLEKHDKKSVAYIYQGLNNDKFSNEEIAQWSKIQFEYDEKSLNKESILQKLRDKQNDTTTNLINPENVSKLTVLPIEDIHYSDTHINKNIQNEIVNLNKTVISENSQQKTLQFRQKQYSQFPEQIRQVFQELENTNYPIYLENFELNEIESEKQDILESDVYELKLILKDENGKKQTARLKVPKISKNGYYYLDGNKRVLINQFVPFPVYIYKPYFSRISTQNRTINVIQRMTTGNKYIISYIAGKRLPLILSQISYIGFDGFLNLYDLKLVETTSQEMKNHNNDSMDGKYYFRTKNKIYYIEYDEPYKYYLLNGLSRTNLTKNEYLITDIHNESQWTNVISFYTQDQATKFKIKRVFDFIIDSLSQNVLAQKGWQTEIMQIIKQLLPKIISGQYSESNDLSFYRIRNFEAISSIIRSHISKAYQLYDNEKRAGLDQKLKLDPNIISKQIKTAQLSQSLEGMNGIEYLSFYDRVSFKGEGSGLSSESVENNDSLRHLSQSYYGIVDPLDTPEGGSIGIVQHLTTNPRINDTNGMMNVLDLKSVEDVDENIFGITLSTIPFSNNSEPTRMLMATAHQKQQQPIENSEPPLTQTGYESLIPTMLSDDFVIKTSFKKQKILDITDKYIKVKNVDNDDVEILDITPKRLKGGQSLNITSKFNIHYKVGDIVTEDDFIQTFYGIKNGVLCQGINLCCAYMMWKGHTFEDGIVISDELADKLTIHRYKEKYIELSPGDKIDFINTGKFTKNDILFSYSPQKIYEVLVFDDDENLSQGKYEVYSVANGEMMNIKIFGNIDIYDLPEEYKKYYDPSKKYYKREPIGDSLIVYISYDELNPVKVGDKLANRHGNKGVITFIEKKENMPVTPWGEKIQLILNPLSVIGRTNTGQIYELYTNFIQKKQQKDISDMNDRDEIISYILDIYKELDGTKNKQIYQMTKTKLNNISKKEFDLYVDNIKKYGLTIYEPPFKTSKLESILNVLKKLGLQTKYYLDLPEYGIKTKRQIQVGYMYEERLEHLSSLKLGQTGRTTNDQRTGQQVKKTGEKQQKVGEQDTYSLLQYNQKNVLAELFNSHADDMKASSRMYNNIITSGRTELIVSEDNKTNDYLSQYLTAMGIDIEDSEDQDDFMF